MGFSLHRLLRPRSLAIFGGSWATTVVEQCQKMGYDGQLWPVHPRKNNVAGVACFSHVSQLPAPPDASFIGVNRDLTIELIAELAAIDAGGAICFASGFSEAEHEDSNGVKKQQALVEAAGTMPIIGPNCYGLINYLDGALLWPDQHGGERVETGVAVLTQSSNIAISLSMQQRGLPIAYVLTAGNQAQQSIADLATAIIEDPRVTAVALHIEGIRSPRSFEKLGQLGRSLGKGIIALKVGSSTQAQQAMISHTKSLSGSNSASTSFLERCGIVGVGSLNTMIETLKLFHVSGIPTGNRLLSMSCSGGEAALVSDTAERYALEFPPLNKAQRSSLRRTLGPMVALANPLDYHTYIWNDRAALEGMFRAMFEGRADIAMLIMDFPRADRCTYESWLVALDALIKAKEHWQGVLVLVSTLSENIPVDIVKKMEKHNIAALQGLDEALQSMAIGARASCLSQRSEKPIWLSDLAAYSGDITIINEHAAKQRLRSFGIATPANIRLTAIPATIPALEDTLAQQRSSLQFPLVVKGLGFAHKAENNAIKLNIGTVAELLAAMNGMHAPEGFLIEEQVQDSALELLVGIVRDPILGFQLTIGAGGTWTEILSDAKHWLLPVDFDRVRQDLQTLRIAPLLNGYRKKPGINWDTLGQTLETLQSAAFQFKDTLVELEINPLLCTPDRCIAIDALLRLNATE